MVETEARLARLEAMNGVRGEQHREAKAWQQQQDEHFRDFRKCVYEKLDRLDKKFDDLHLKVTRNQVRLGLVCGGLVLALSYIINKVF